MSIDGPQDVDGLRRAGAAVAAARDRMAREVRPGVTTRELDAIGREVLAQHGARSAPQLAYSFPGVTCISVNDELAHGIPSERRLEDGDVVNIDVSAELDGYWADSGASYPVGNVAPRLRSLLHTTRQALDDAIREVRAGAPGPNLGRAVARRPDRAGFRVERALRGHGGGRNIHEPPNVPNTFDQRNADVLREGLVITIEPFLTTGATSIYEADDGWTLRTPDGSIGAQFEHTLIVTRGEPMIVTRSAS